MYSIVDVRTNQVVPQFGRSDLIFTGLNRVVFAPRVVVFNPTPGYEYPPQYGEVDDRGIPLDPPIEFRLYDVTFVEVGTGPRVVSASPPVYKRGPNIVEVRQSMGPALPVPTPADNAKRQMTDDPFMRAWVKRQARKEGKTPRQIMNEIQADA